jgi:prophage regulatory protein
MFQEIQFYRISHLQKRLGVSRSSLWSWVKQGLFPKPIKLGKNCTAWNSADIDNWISERKSISEKGGE